MGFETGSVLKLGGTTQLGDNITDSTGSLFIKTVLGGISSSLPIWDSNKTLTNSILTQSGSVVYVSGSINTTSDSTFNSIVVGLGSGNLSSNLAIGTSSLVANTTGNYCIAIGKKALSSNTVGYDNVALGYSSLRDNTSGVYNTAFGVGTLEHNTTGSNNTAIGGVSMYHNISGSSNTGLGYGSLYNNLTGSNNTAIGYYSLLLSTWGNNNTVLGASSSYDLVSGSNNTMLGYYTGLGVISGSNNTIVGANVSGLDSGLSNNIILSDGNGNIGAQYNGSMWKLTGSLSVQSIVENIISINNPTGIVVNDFNVSDIFYNTSITGDFGVNFINTPLTDGSAIGFAEVLIQGATAYMITSLEVNGVSQVINWYGGVTPTGNPNKIDVVGFSLIRLNSNWTVLGQMSTFG